ncbi:pseudouridine-5'-phosphatase [Bacillus rossius redtenbacheri]|uniref:pseudouridine-5'-phosphatase n=1 Tax=Bacillus rossius redtenbacheri TaxID=93214 RepID=UPI002FDD9935
MEMREVKDKACYRPVTHVIFDCDGLLLDTERLYEKIHTELASKYGKTYTFETKIKILGTPELDSNNIIINDLGLPITAEEMAEYMREREQVLFPTVNTMPGVERLVRHLAEHNVPIAIATSSSMRATRLKMSRHQELWSLFSHTVAASSDPEVKRGKPAPDIFLVCACRFPDKPRPAQCLVVEDAPNGVEGALAAGMQVVMVPDPRVPEDRTKRATRVLATLEDFKPQLFGLPAFPE